MGATEAPERRQKSAGFLQAVQRGLQALADVAHAHQRDERLEDLVGSFANGIDPRVAHHALVRLVAEVALAAEYLQRLVDAVPKGFGRKDLEDGGLEHVI